MNRILIIALLVLLCSPAAASAAPTLTKREARTEGLRFVAPFVDMLDTDRTVSTEMVPASMCARVNGTTIRCRFTAYYISEGRSIAGSVKVHRQTNGLLGFLLSDLDAAAAATPLRRGLR